MEILGRLLILLTPSGRVISPVDLNKIYLVLCPAKTAEEVIHQAGYLVPLALKTLVGSAHPPGRLFNAVNP
jgi:hypothetical protein